ncbi:hypothetical protein XENOCAPTIV_002440 [Xenoophorus captivus]|uniref:UTP23 sensor motif region domain-containing protein n=1 Tax=Xenoophorus captivus TaxID=1517983 RepID=A0ABV0RY67_9TELE
MKIKRQKQAKKTISFYKYNFSFREPFQILIDGTFCQAALKNKIQIKEQMPKYLMGEVRKCAHLKNPVPASECLLSMLEETNPHHYFVATQDHAVTAGLKKIPGVPLLYIILNTIVLDKPSQTSLNHVQAVQLGELVTPAQQQSIRSLKEEQGIKDGERRGKKRKRKQSNPNPLSCLKKKKKGGPTPSLKKTEPGEKRKRSRHKRRKAAGGDDTAASNT